MLLQKIGARVWIARILLSWGIVAILTGFARTAAHLYILRFLLGVAEAGYVPGIYLYLTHWFPQRQLAQATALFNTGNPVANIVAAPLSGLILDRIHWFELSSWRWLLILEAIPALVGGILTYFLLPGRPAEARFLAAEEKEWITAELTREEQQKLTARRITVGEALAHTLKTLSSEYSNTTVGILVMIPYIVAVPAMIFVSRSSDRTLERRYHAAIPVIIGATSLLLLGASIGSSAFASVMLWCSAAAGTLSLLAPFWSLPNEFLSGFSAAAGIALINSFGNLGGFIGPYVMGAINKETGSFRGGLVFAGISLFASGMLMLALRKRTEH